MCHKFSNLKLTIKLVIFHLSTYILRLNKTFGGIKMKIYLSVFLLFFITNSYGQNDRLEFQTIYDRIFGPKCIQCHSGAFAPHEIDLTLYENLWKTSGHHGILKHGKKKLIVKGKPEKSIIYLEVESGRMPLIGERLSDEDITLLYDWIFAGAPEFSND